MIGLIVLCVVAIVLCVGAVHAIRDDRARELPRSRFVSPDLRPPAHNDRHGLAIQHWARGRPR